MLTGQTAALVTREAQRGQYGKGGTSFPRAHDADHQRAAKIVQHGAEDWSEVRSDGPYPAPLLFWAYRVSATSWAWQTPAMSAPAFEGYEPHDALVTDQYGTFCPGCREG